MKRYGLLWMSREDVVRVRNDLVGLYLKPDEPLIVKAPSRATPVPVVRIFTGTFPRFEWLNSRAWLKCPKDERAQPYWDYQCTTNTLETDAVRIPFKDPQARLPAMLIKEFARYFPFLPSDNYFTHHKDHFYA